MRLDTLQRVFERLPRFKLFVLTENGCLCGYASNPRVTDQGMLVDIGTSIRVDFQSNELTQESTASAGLHLNRLCKVTRRIRTHERHLDGKSIPEQYLILARAL